MRGGTSSGLEDASARDADGPGAAARGRLGDARTCGETNSSDAPAWNGAGPGAAARGGSEGLGRAVAWQGAQARRTLERWDGDVRHWTVHADGSTETQDLPLWLRRAQLVKAATKTGCKLYSVEDVHLWRSCRRAFVCGSLQQLELAATDVALRTAVAGDPDVWMVFTVH